MPSTRTCPLQSLQAADFRGNDVDSDLGLRCQRIVLVSLVSYGGNIHGLRLIRFVHKTANFQHELPRLIALTSRCEVATMKLDGQTVEQCRQKLSQRREEWNLADGDDCDVVDLHRKNLEDVDVLELCDLNHAIVLHLGTNDLRYIPSGLTAPVLRVLDLSVNHLESLGGFPSFGLLRTLSLANNRLDSLEQLPDLPCLTELVSPSRVFCLFVGSTDAVLKESHCESDCKHGPACKTHSASSAVPGL